MGGGVGCTESAAMPAIISVASIVEGPSRCRSSPVRRGVTGFASPLAENEPVPSEPLRTPPVLLAGESGGGTSCTPLSAATMLSICSDEVRHMRSAAVSKVPCSNVRSCVAYGQQRQRWRR